MKASALLQKGSVFLAGALVLSAIVGAQQKTSSVLPQARAYDRNREVSLMGTVVEYRPSSSTPLPGAHVIVQTSSGIVDVHLGNPRMLMANHFSLAPGDTVRIVGENLNEPLGTQFVARLLQKGAQSLAVRSLQGIPLKPGRMNSNGAGTQNQQGGVL